MAASFTLSPATGPANEDVPVVASGVGTFWVPGVTGFNVTGGAGGQGISGLTVLSSVQAVFTLLTGVQPGALTITDDTDGASATFMVTGATGATFSYDPTTPIGQVRLQTGDMDLSNADPTTPREEWSCLFTDQELQYFLNKWGQDVDRATIEALRFIAARPQMQVRALRVLNLDMEIGDLAGALNKLADELRDSRAQMPWEEIAEVGVNDFSRRTIIFNRIQRLGGGPI